jgi:hypothetical protein
MRKRGSDGTPTTRGHRHEHAALRLRLNDNTVRAVWTQKARADADARELALAKGRVIVLEERANSQQADNMHGPRRAMDFL